MDTLPPESGKILDAADLLAWQALLRHETLQVIKSGTFVQLVSCPELMDLIAQSMAMNKHMLQLLYDRFDSVIP
ncbi:hypothetical protein P4H66_11070 [Paenibacillus dokdonensis]|uniref:Uncharacterized protein n=1 Tax=Paenibacillus dokdonensis TaxID=2567944 RepID=A0ABU6GKX3_9BACL|nr:hypothetical protein [Paenibacillus dokdonensis]MEC0240392.1 hypothetical protein [Paenibacillus dokdonensis]